MVTVATMLVNKLELVVAMIVVVTAHPITALTVLYLLCRKLCTNWQTSCSKGNSDARLIGRYVLQHG